LRALCVVASASQRETARTTRATFRSTPNEKARPPKLPPLLLSHLAGARWQRLQRRQARAELPAPRSKPLSPALPSLRSGTPRAHATHPVVCVPAAAVDVSREPSAGVKSAARSLWRRR